MVMPEAATSYLPAWMPAAERFPSGRHEFDLHAEIGGQLRGDVDLIAFIGAGGLVELRIRRIVAGCADAQGAAFQDLIEKRFRIGSCGGSGNHR